MLPLEHKILFFVFALIAGAFGLWGFYRLYLRIRRGASAVEPRWNNLPERLGYALRTSLTQERTFRRRPWVSVLHAFIFYGFTYYLLVNIVDGLEGYFHFNITSGNPLGAIYNVLADILSFLVLVGVIALVIRRLFLPSKRDFKFTEKTLLHPLLKRNFILRDSLIVSAFITFHVGSRVLGQGAKMALEGGDPFQPFSTFVGNTLFGGLSEQAQQGWRIFGYWGALGSVLAFLAYFPFSKHIHIFMAPLKYTVRRPVPTGVIPPMKGLEEAMEAEEPKLGVQKLEDLEWPRLLDAYACIQCNRCQDVCPANATGKALSPAALEINKRMELNVIAAHPSPFTLKPAAFESGASTAHPLLEFAINEESVWACTTCGACMQVCPVQDEQMLDIIDIRRHQVMVAGEFPPQLQTAFRGMERASNPWGISRDKRMEWAEGLRVPTIDENPEPDVLYWVGCAASYDPGAQKVARSFVQLLDKAGVSYAVLGKKEACTGDSARRSGNEFLFQSLAQENVETLNTVRPKLIVSTCPHCMNAIGNEYKQLGGDYQVIHHTEYLENLVTAGKLPMAQLQESVTYHDPCYLGRHNGVYDAPRTLITRMAGEVLELERARENSFCCGAGGAQFWKEEEEGRERLSDNRFREIQARLDAAKEGKVVAVGCPFCKSMLNSTPEKAKRDDIVVRDVAELMLESVQRATGEWMAPTAAPESTLEESPIPTVPITAQPVAQSGETPGAGADPDILGQTSAEVINAQPGSPTANAGTQPEPQDTVPSPVTSSSADSSPRKEWKPKGGADDVAQAAPATQPTGAPARKAWKPKSGGDDVSEAPVEAASSQPSANETATSNTPARKAWKPKSSGDDVSAAPGEAVSSQAPTSEAPASARKAWKPKAANDDVSPAPATPEAPSIAETPAAPARKAWKPRAEAQPEAQASEARPEPTPVLASPAAEATPAPAERKKWSPKGTAAQPAAAESVPQPEAVPVAEPAPTPQPGERKKWSPKAPASAAPAEAPAPPVEAMPAAPVTPPTSGERPKWQPKAKVETSVAAQPVAEAAPASQNEPAASGPVTQDAGARKKWVPKKKD